MPNITKWTSSGLHSIQVGGKGSGGNFSGFADLTTADVGTASSMRLLVGGVTAPTPTPQSNRVYNRGRDGYISGYIFDAAPNDFAMVFEDFDGDLAAFLNHDIVMTEGEWDVIAEGGEIEFRNTMWLLCREAQSKESGADNAPGFENLLIMSAGGRIEAGNMEFQSAGQFNVQAVASPVQKTFKGTTALASHGKNTIYTERWFSEFPCSMCLFVGNAVITAVPLGTTPISVAKTRFYLWSTGAALTVNSVDTSAKTATLSAAPASAALAVGIWETQDI